MGFTPPQFNDLGKKAKDILSKKYDFRTEVKSVNKASGGITLESGNTFAKANDSYLKGNYKCSDYGEFEAELHTAGDTKAKAKFDKFAAGSAVTLNVSSKPDLSVEATYAQDKFASILKFSQAGNRLGLNVAATVGMDGYSAGVSSNLDLSGGNVAMKGLDFAAEARYGDIHAALKSANQGQVSVYYKLSSVLTLGSSLALKDKSVNLGTEYTLSKATGLKGRANSNGLLAFAVEHKLADPSVKIAASAEFDATNMGAAAKKFGLSFVIGDY